MNRLVTELGLIAALIGTFGLMVALPNKSVHGAETEAKSRAVKITAYDESGASQGTGTMLGHNRILTNAHLFPQRYNDDLKIVFRRYDDEKFFSAVIESSDTAKDFAILRFNGKDETRELKITEHWYLGEQLVLLGNPEKGDFILGHTRIVAYSFVRNPDDYIRTMLLFPCDTGAPGFSGSGVYNLQGEFMGIFELKSNYSNTCFAIPAGEVLIRGLNKPWELK